MEPGRFTLRAAVYLFLINDGKILLLRRFNTGWQDGMYSLIAGHLDGGETITATMAREAKEEAGIIINPQDLKVVHIIHRNTNPEYIDFFLIADKWKRDPINKETDRCDDMRWVDLDKLPDTLLPHVKQALIDYQKNIAFSESLI